MSAFRAQVNDDIRCQNNIQIVFDYYYRVSVSTRDCNTWINCSTSDG